jgi:hypothetical protein
VRCNPGMFATPPIATLIPGNVLIAPGSQPVPRRTLLIATRHVLRAWLFRRCRALPVCFFLWAFRSALLSRSSRYCFFPRRWLVGTTLIAVIVSFTTIFILDRRLSVLRCLFTSASDSSTRDGAISTVAARPLTGCSLLLGFRLASKSCHSLAAHFLVPTASCWQY